MKQEDKELLLADLSARLPYGVMLKHISIEKPFKLFSIKRDEYESYKKDGVELAVNGIYYDWYINDTYHDIELYIKPYLRRMSSMTEEEWEELNSIGHIVPLYDGCFGVDMRAYCKNGQPHYRRFSDFSTIEDWFNAHHFDYRGLIEKELALEAQGMYNIKEYNKI